MVQPEHGGKVISLWSTSWDGCLWSDAPSKTLLNTEIDNTGEHLVSFIEGCVLMRGQLTADVAVVPGRSGRVGPLKGKRGKRGFLNRHV